MGSEARSPVNIACTGNSFVSSIVPMLSNAAALIPGRMRGLPEEEITERPVLEPGLFDHALLQC